ncbi:MAG: hypothetical protein QXI87_08075 [Thermoproteota archaeon]
MEYGKRVGTANLYVPRALLTEATHGAAYEIQIKTKGVPDPKQAIETLTKELPKKFDLTVHYVRIENNDIYIQISPNHPFVWAALLAILPEILSLIGIVVLLIAVYLVWVHIPSWVVALLVIGGALTYFGPKIGAIIMPKKV